MKYAKKKNKGSRKMRRRARAKRGEQQTKFTLRRHRRTIKKFSTTKKM